MVDQSNVLLLQGPHGSFFSRYAKYLKERHNTVWKINFNGGDLFFSRAANAVNYRGSIDEWPDFLATFLSTHSIGRIYLFGDCRQYHREAVKVATLVGVRIFVFEEGYIRPDYITLEEGGVNANSSLPRDPAFYLRSQIPEKKEPIKAAGTSFTRMACSATAYYLSASVLRPFFPRYQHHRSVSASGYAFTWVRSAWRKLLTVKRDEAFTRVLASTLSKRYFLVPLQVHNDAQVTHHSSYPDIEQFIVEVIQSFARCAPRETALVLKHHPMDRGDCHYGALINGLAKELGIVTRVHYAHQLHLPTALDHARGVIVINSTVGLSALLHKAPVKVMGNAIYDMKGLTSQRPLDRFWREPGKINPRLHQAFRQYIITHTQINGSFYGLEPFPLMEMAVRPTAQYGNASLSQQA